LAVGGGLSFTAISTKYNHTCGLAADGDAYCWGYNTSAQLGDGTYEGTRATPVRVVP
jgi:alpha-tubulin suppressor-like RCC1 family protein